MKRMTSANYEDAVLVPLTTDAEIVDRVAGIVGRANQRQLWLMFLDETNTQLPLLIPIDALPSEPTDVQTALVLDHVREVMGEMGASSLLFVHERYAASSLLAQDVAWAQSLRRACEGSGVVLRAQLLSHRSGVRMIESHELDAEV
jgi:hypothetical protein